MATEDGFLLGELISQMQSSSELPDLLHRYEKLRIPRTRLVKHEALRNCELWHLPNGPRQELRDANALQGMTPEGQSPYIWGDVDGQEWLYGYDLMHACKQQKSEEPPRRLRTEV